MDQTTRPRTLPEPFAGWFAARGWQSHPHQLDLIQAAAAPSTLLIAPTGGGKTLAGFLPSLIELGPAPTPGLHTLYISPLKALAADIRRNLGIPIDDMNLAIRVEDRTGDTKPAQRARQRMDPPHMLLTTPESLALMLSYEEAPRIFGQVSRVIVDEVHALAESKRGDQLMLCLARLQSLAPDMRRIGLSATVEDPPALAVYLGPDTRILLADPGPDPDISMLETPELPPWLGQGGRYAARAVMDLVRDATTTLIFINTRAQAELFFQALWAENTGNLAIGLHHGSLSREARAKVEAAMVAGDIRAIVCTGSLDLGIDWGDVDLVIQIGAPKNVKRLVQRIGRANHRYNAPSKALLVPANRFEVVECVAALDAVKAGELDGDPRGPGPRDVLCQHILISACAGPIYPGALFKEVTSAGAYSALTRSEFDTCLAFCATGGYALRAYDRWQRLQQDADGLWHLRDPRAAQRIRMNIGTIQDTDTLKVRLKRARGGKPLGEIEEGFAASLTLGDTFLIGGQIVRYEGLREMTVEVTRRADKKPKIATFMGTKFSTSTQLSQRVLSLFQHESWPNLPSHTAEWLTLQRTLSKLPEPNRLLIESFPQDGRAHTCVYGFAGRNAQQTLGLLLTKRLDELGLNPLGFVATDYATLIWGLDVLDDPAPLFDIEALHDGLENWLAGNAVMKRTFRASATIAGLIERNSPSAKKSGRQATFSSDILYDTLLKYDPDHLMMQITRQEALRGLVDFDRIKDMARRIEGRIDHIHLPHVSPLAAPMFLEMGKVPIKGSAEEKVLAEEAAALMQAAGLRA
jgi:ATP-dependent Lhr-like helicase